MAQIEHGKEFHNKQQPKYFNNRISLRCHDDNW